MNHDLSQIFVGVANLRTACGHVAAEIIDWEPARHAVDYVDVVERFPTERHARAYAAWLIRDGAFEGLEHYAMGLDEAQA
jgi:hypothetical protein